MFLCRDHIASIIVNADRGMIRPTAMPSDHSAPNGSGSEIIAAIGL